MQDWTWKIPETSASAANNMADEGYTVYYTLQETVAVEILIKIIQNCGIPGEQIQLAEFLSRLKMAGPIGGNWNERLEM